MKREKLLKHLRDNNCSFLREGGSHSIYINTINDKISAVPRHSEVNKLMVRKICTELCISKPAGD